MINCYVEDFPKNSILIPWEINNSFLAPLHFSSKSKKWILPYDIFLGLHDLWKVIIKFEKLNHYSQYLDSLEKNIDSIIKVIPLPENMWAWDGHYYEWFLSDEKKNLVKWFRSCKKSDILLLINLIRNKVLEAKNKQKSLIFWGEGSMDILYWWEDY